MTQRRHLSRTSNDRESQRSDTTPKHQAASLHVTGLTSHPLTPEDILSLQRAIGNRAVSDLLGSVTPAPVSKPAIENEGTDLQAPSDVRFHSTGIDHPISIQRKIYSSMSKMWEGVKPGIKKKKIEAIIGSDGALAQAYTDLTAHLNVMDFIYVKGKQPEADMVPNSQGIYKINYGKMKELGKSYGDPTRYVSAMLHEMMHITAALQYSTNVPPGSEGHAANMNLPARTGNAAEWGMTEDQFNDTNMGAVKQMETMFANWEHLRTIADADVRLGSLSNAQGAFIHARIDYALKLPEALAHYDTVLLDVLYTLASQGAQQSQSYVFVQQMLTEANARRSSGQGAVRDMTQG